MFADEDGRGRRILIRKIKQIFQKCKIKMEFIALLLMVGVIPSAIGGVHLCRNMINNAKEDMIL